MFKINWKPTLLFALLAMGALVAMLVEVILNNLAVSMQIFSLYSILGVIAVALGATMHYQCWKAIPEKYRRTTPGRAVGLLFVPVYHLYWYFVSFIGLGKGLKSWNREITGRQAHTGFKLGVGIATIFALFFVKSVVNLFFPMTVHLQFYIGAGLIAAAFILMVAYYSRVIYTIYRLRQQSAQHSSAIGNA